MSDASDPSNQAASSARGDRRRQQILEIATARFAETGYRGASLRDIAHQVGITHPGLLYHFGSKEELLMAVLAHLDSLGGDMVRRSEDARSTLDAWLHLAAPGAEHRGLVELYATLAAEAVDPAHPAHDYFLRRQDRMVMALGDLFGDLDAEGALATDAPAPRVLAQSFMALIDGLRLQWLMRPDALDVAELLRTDINTLLVDPLPAPTPA